MVAFQQIIGMTLNAVSMLGWLALEGVPLASTSQLLVQIIKFEVMIIASSNDVINSNMKNSSRDINNNRFDVRRKGFL